MLTNYRFRLKDKHDDELRTDLGAFAFDAGNEQRLHDAAELARGCGAFEGDDGAWAFSSIAELADFIDTVRLMAAD